MHDLLPDRWEGMSGSYMGKDYSSFQALLDIYDVEDRKEVCFFLKHIEARNATKINDKLNKKQKANEQKAKGGGINSANLQR